MPDVRGGRCSRALARASPVPIEIEMTYRIALL